MVGDPKLIAAALAAALCIAGCGGGESTASTDGEDVLYPWLKGPSREFLVRKGDNVVQTYGREASGAERAQADRVIQGWMRARAATDFKQDCRSFSRRYRKVIVNDARNVTDGKVERCPGALVFFGELASGNYVNTLTGPIDSLRVAEDLAYAQYHGRGGKDWIVPMDLEGGKWKVSIAAPIGRHE
jgi:hypothetical protein